MAPSQPITIIDLLPWPRLTVTRLSLSELVTVVQLAMNEDGRPAVWIVPQLSEREPNPPYGYIVSFICFHERGFAALASRFMRALCYHYGVELHNFTPNAISQVATFVGVCDGLPGHPSELGSLGSPLPRGAAHADYAGAEDLPRAACRRHDDHVEEHAQGALHPLHDDFQQRGVGADVVLPPQRQRVLPPYS
jgi:hypothetical protein